MIRSKPAMDVTGRWLIVCDCAGRPEELVGVVDVTAAGEVRVWDTGRGGRLLSMKGAERRLRAAPASKRRELVQQLQTREIALPVTVSFTHAPCGLELKVKEARFGELLTVIEERHGPALALVFAYGEERGLPLSLLVQRNGEVPGGATR